LTTHNDVSELVGNTPLVKLDKKVTGLENTEVYVKLEYLNPFGSIKDRIAWNLLKDDIENIKQNERTVLESSSGNTAKAIQALTSKENIDFKTVTNRIKVDEVKDILITLGTNIEELPGKSECPDPSNPDDPLTKLDEMEEQNPDKYFRTGQYTDEANTEAHYEGTGKEILNDLENVDVLAGGLGTTGSTKGTAKRLQQENSELDVFGVVSAPGDYIPGIRTSKEMWEVGLYQKELYNEVIEVESTEAIDEMLNLIRNAGIMAGPTTGANLKALKKQLKNQETEEKKTAVIFACDRFEHYISYIKERKPEIYGKKKRNKYLSDLSQQEVEEHSTAISVETAEKKIEEENPIVIDTRSPTAFKIGHIPGSVNIPEDQFDQIVRHGTPFCKDKEAILVCPIGEKSLKYSALLQERGHKAYSLEKGINSWKNLDKQLEKNI